LVKFSNLILKDGKDGGSRVARLKLDGERMSENVLLGLLLVDFSAAWKIAWNREEAAVVAGAWGMDMLRDFDGGGTYERKQREDDRQNGDCEFWAEGTRHLRLVFVFQRRRRRAPMIIDAHLPWHLRLL
jgi:hypothetical protein